MLTTLFASIPGSALASSGSPYDSGYDHGCDDAQISDPSDRYINQPEKGPSYHTSEFMDGYNAGLGSCSSSSSQNYYEPPQNSPSRNSQPNCNAAGLVGGVIGGALGSLAGPEAAIGGFSAGSSYLKDTCESNRN